MRIALYRNLTFEAAHRNPHAGPGSPQARVHGHSYQARVFVEGVVDSEMGWLMDFAEIRRACGRVIHQVDHYLLNDVPGLEDASLAGLQSWLSVRLTAAIPSFSHCEVQILGDTELSPAITPESESYPGTGLQFGFAAAHSLPRVPAEHKCRRLHGHSYRVIVGASPKAMAEVDRAVRALYPTVGHCVLNDIPGLENPTAEHLAQWLWERLTGDGCRIDAVTVGETCTSGCVYRGRD